MGGLQSALLKKNLETYVEETFLTRSEIIHIHQIYLKLGGEDDDVSRLSLDQENPFKRRMCEVFSEDDSGDLTFLEFLDMFSVFNEKAPLEPKIFYAYQIYDYNGDNKIDLEDLKEVTARLTGIKDDNEDFTDDDIELKEITWMGSRFANELSNLHSNMEADVDGDGIISFWEFRTVASRSHAFAQTFRMRL
eukprot:gene4155-6507_t